MEEAREQRHVCKFCDKYFPCGRSLGGHMRSHMRNNGSFKKKEKAGRKKLGYAASVNGGSNTSLVDFEDGEQAGYGLRENPRKTWRLSDSNDCSFKEARFCSECGKGFQSLKALCGHMASHSGKERVCDSLEEDSWIGGCMDSQSETETAAPKRGRRSRRARYKNTSTVTAASSLSIANASSCDYEIEHEQEDVARCLMMLSRDEGYWDGVKSVSVESSDNSYVAGEVRSSNLVKENSEYAQLELMKSVLGHSGVGSSRNVFKKLESAVSIDGSTAEHKFKKPKSDNRKTGFELSKVELGEVYSKKKLKCSEAELRKNLIKEANDQIDSECGRRNLGKRISRSNDSDLQTLEDYCKKVTCVGMESPSKSKYECAVCHKVFNSYQALGGHRASHKRTNSSCALKTESTETSTEIKSPSTNSSNFREGAGCIEASNGSLKKIKHECPTCFRVFASGQALGGHKRSHALETSETREDHTIVIPQQLPVIRDLLDLNLPAQDEEDTNTGIGFEQWWAVNNQKHEQAVGVIFN